MIYLKQWHRSGITYINDLLNEDLSLLSYNVFQQTFHLKVPFTTYYGLINAIPPSWKREFKSTGTPLENENMSQEPFLPKNNC